jgi:hypothetical protein
VEAVCSTQAHDNVFLNYPSHPLKISDWTATFITCNTNDECVTAAYQSNLICHYQKHLNDHAMLFEQTSNVYGGTYHLAGDYATIITRLLPNLLHAARTNQHLSSYQS